MLGTDIVRPSALMTMAREAVTQHTPKNHLAQRSTVNHKIPIEKSTAGTCTSSAFRGLVIHQNEPARQRARELANTPEFAKAQRQRKKVEALFAELKNQIGLRRLRLRRLKFVREQIFLSA